MPWMHIKLGFVFLLYVYHLKCHQIFKQLQRDQIKYSASFFRLWNEGATLLLFAIVFIVILKSTLSWIFGVLGLFGLAILLMIGIKHINDTEKNIPMRSGKEYIIGGFISLLVGTFGCTSQEELRKVFSFPSQMKEVSGVTYDAKRSMLWAIEDSGNRNEVYGIDTLGTVVKTIAVNGVENNDWRP